jgi:alkyl hydroperoxide reductase subunit AhpC
MNDLPGGRSVDEALRVIQTFQFTVSGFLYFVWRVALTQRG